MSGGLRLVCLCLVGAFLSLLTGCGSASCGGASVSTSGGSATAGTSAGNPSSCSSGGGGGTSGNGTALDYIFTLDGFSISGAYYTGSSTLAISSFNAPAIGSGSVADMAIANGQFLYLPFVPTSGSSVLQGYSIASSTGALSAIGGSPFTTHSVTDSLVADPKSRFLFASEGQTSTVEVFQINPTTGALTTAPGGPYPLDFVPFSIAVDGTGTYLYVATDSGEGWTYGYNINPTTGALTPISGSPWPLSIVEVSGEATGQFLIGRGAGVLQVFGLTSGTGVPLPITSISPASNATNHFVVHPSGKFIYTFSQQISGGSNFPVEGFSLDGSGTITAMTGSPFTTLTSIYAGKIDPNGTALVGLTPDGQFQVFAINTTTGALTSTSQPYTGVANVFFAVTN
jgi:6-phosphogluconolactonase